MVQVYVSLGSNIDAEHNLCACLDRLRASFGAVSCSPVYQTPALGFAGPPFLNAVVGFQTELDCETLQQWLRALEDQQGRQRTDEKFNSRTLDADLLLYGDLVLPPAQNLPHSDILEYPFVLYPLAELAPDFKHPLLQQDLQAIARTSGLKTDDLQAVQLNCSKANRPTASARNGA